MGTRGKWVVFALASVVVGTAASPPRGSPAAAVAAETRRVRQNERFVTNLLNGTEAQLRRAEALVNWQNRLLAREQFLSLLTPRSERQARLIQQLQWRDEAALERTGHALAAAKARFDADQRRNASAVYNVNRLTTSNPSLVGQLADFGLRALQTFTRQSVQGAQTFGLAAASPIHPLPF